MIVENLWSNSLQCRARKATISPPMSPFSRPDRRKSDAWPSGIKSPATASSSSDRASAHSQPARQTVVLWGNRYTVVAGLENRRAPAVLFIRSANWILIGSDPAR